MLPAGFFDTDQVNEIRLYFAQANWDEILDSLYARGDESRLIGHAMINGRRFDSVGVRYKGHSSYHPARRKNPINIKLDYVRAEQMEEGHGTLRLANVYKDPSFVREVLSYEIARHYMPASFANFANIYVNDTLIGLYTNVQDVDPRFMRTWFLCDKNARFKGQMRESVPMVVGKYYGPDSTPYLDYYELESASGWHELIAFLDTLNHYPQAVEHVLDVDRLLWMLAFDVLLVNLDAPVNTAQNFYLYRNASGRFVPIVWDLNENFGAYRNLEGTGQLTVAQMQQLDLFLRTQDTNYPIVSKILSNPRWGRMYVAHLRTILNEQVLNGRYRERALELQSLIDTFVQTDPNKFYGYNDFLDNIDYSVGSGPLAIVGLSQLMNARGAYLNTRPELQASPPLILSAGPVTSPLRPNSEAQFLARVANADSVFLYVRQNPAASFARLTMFDDGRHGDGNAADGIFGTSFRTGAGSLQYYLYSENSEAGAFSPERAAQEYRTIPVTGSVVINEFLAINDTTIPDQNGQYDDWIELFNNSSRSLSLDGYLLTNDSSRLAKWVFPDTSIAPGGYCVVWADNDERQSGLHANFKLDGGSGVL
ncbi:MAG: CotH kinase family protein, partial [candidate division WOR-3 bacterium]